MPLKNIVTDQRVTKAKLQRAKELRREMTLAEKPAKRLAASTPAGTFGVRRSWESAFGGSKSLRDSLLTFTATKQR
jgi:hypothetical protein